MWAFQLFHFSGSRVQFSRQVGMGGIYRYLGDIRHITERGRPHLQSLTVTSLKSSGSWGLSPIFLEFPIFFVLTMFPLAYPIVLEFPIILVFPFSLYFSPSSNFLFSRKFFCCCWYDYEKTPISSLTTTDSCYARIEIKFSITNKTLELRIVKVQFSYDRPGVWWIIWCSLFCLLVLHSLLE